MTMLFPYQDRVPVYRHEVQRRGSCQVGAALGVVGTSWRLFVDEMGENKGNTQKLVHNNVVNTPH